MMKLYSVSLQWRARIPGKTGRIELATIHDDDRQVVRCTYRTLRRGGMSSAQARQHVVAMLRIGQFDAKWVSP